MSTKKKLTGACLIPVKERNYKKKSCKCCGEYFKPLLPYEKYCCAECRQIGASESKRASNKKQWKRKRAEQLEYIASHHFCPECGEPLPNAVQHVHFECMIKKWREGDRSQKTKWYFYNKGYNQKDVNELAYGEGM